MQVMVVILLLAIVFICPVVFLFPLIKPKWYFKKGDKTRKDVLKYFGVAEAILVVLFLGGIFTLPKVDETKNDSKDTSGVVKSATQVSNQPTPEVTPTPSPEPEKHTVSRVIDGDTIELSTGEKVRYIGIDTPEIKHPSKGIECYGKEALEKNSELVSGKKVRLEKDVSETDRYGRLLRYIHVDDVFVNDYLVRQGYAHASSYPPDIKHQDQLKEAEIEARENKRGLWSDVCYQPATPTPQSQSKPVSKPVVTQPPAPQPQTGSYACDCNKLCGQMSSCDEAYYQLNQCGCSKRDSDSDGVPCESICN